MKLKSKLLGLAAMALTAIGFASLSTPARADTITCAQYGTNFATYPTDGKNSHAYLCTNVTQSLTPTVARANTLFGAVSSGYQSHGFPTNVRSTLQSANVKYFFFNSRSDADTYFKNTAPYNSLPIQVTQFVGGKLLGGGTRCGITGYGYDASNNKVIAIAVYDNCSYDNNLQPHQTVVNPSLERTVLHESGHAFDFTYGTVGSPSNVPSARQGFKNFADGDVQNLTPANWTSMTGAQRNLWVCNLFPNPYQPSLLELDLGASQVGGPQFQVCGSGNQRYVPYVASPPNPANDELPANIAQEKFPYFTKQGTNYYQELWAELFVNQAFLNGSPPAFLQMTDHTLQNDTVSPHAFNCTRGDLNSYINTLAPPASVSGCTINGPL
jgi:hypothetical protein